MNAALAHDLEKIQAHAFGRADWTEGTIRRFHAIVSGAGGTQAALIRRLYDWLFVPISLWPFNIQNVLDDCLTILAKGKRLAASTRLIIELLPEPPDESVCTVVARHEHDVATGIYENLVKTQAKYLQNELAIKNDPELLRQWADIKTTFDVHACQDHKGVVRRSMSVERNLRPSFAVNLRRRDEAFQTAFDAFCLRWNLYGMQHDEPLLLKLTVNLTPYGTMIHIPAYWSFDPKRDIRWDAIAKLHRKRVSGRQGTALAEGVAERRKAAAKLKQLDLKVQSLGLKGEKKHEFLCAGLGWDVRTSPKRLSRLRKEFEKRQS